MADASHPHGPAPRALLAPLVLALVLVAALAAMLLVWTHQRAEVWLSAPLDDAFIHFQYAKQLARGHLLQFNDGDSPTTGATSLLYLFLLAPGWLIGFRELWLLVWAMLVNGLLQVAGGVTLFATVRRLGGGKPLAYAGLLLLLLNGPLLWGVFSAMEIALCSTLLLLTLHGALRLTQLEDGEDDPAPGALRSARRRLLLWGALLALSRPEGALLAGGLSLWLLWRALFGTGEATASGEGPVSPLAWLRALPRRLWEARALLIPLGSAAALVLLFALLTGRMGTNAAIKSHLTLLPHEPGHYARLTADWLPMTLRILVDCWPAPLRPLAGALVLLGLAGWSAQGRLRRPSAGALALLWLLLLSLFYALAMARRDHFDRYYLPYFGLTLVAACWTLRQLHTRLRLPRHTAGLLALLLLLYAAPQVRFWGKRYADNCRDLAQQHFKVATWLRQNTPKTARIAVNDAGAIPYLSERYTYDIVGLAHNDFYKLKKVMPPSNAPVWEALAAARPRPDYVVAYPEWIPDIHQLRPFEVRTRFRLVGRTIVANETKVVWRMRWDELLSGDVPRQSGSGAAELAGLAVVDGVNVAHIKDERAHGYALLDEDKPHGVVRQQRLGEKSLVEGGRLVAEGERFSLRARPGKAARLLLRTFGPGQLKLAVTVGGRKAGRIDAALAPGLNEPTLALPAALVRGERLQITVTSEAGSYGSYRYLLLQK